MQNLSAMKAVSNTADVFINMTVVLSLLRQSYLRLGTLVCERSRYMSSNNIALWGKRSAFVKSTLVAIQ